MPKLSVTIQGRTFEVDLQPGHQGDGHFVAIIDGEPVDVMLPERDDPTHPLEWMIVDNHPYEMVIDANLRWVRVYSGIYQVDIRDLEAQYSRPRGGDGRIKAPIPGLIARVLVEPGQAVEAGEPVVVLEAMKMENEIVAPIGGVVSAVQAQPGATVLRNQLLVEIR